MIDESTLIEDIADRLIAERVRLGYSKADFAREVGISRNTYRAYEMGESSIPSNVLVRMGAIGVDVLYLLFNEKNQKFADNFADKNREAANTNAEKIVNSASLSNSIIAGSGSTIHNISTTHHTTKTIAKVKPGEEHITDEQAALLQLLVNEVALCEKYVKQNPRNHRAIWSALNSHMKVPSYRLIKKEQFEKAEKYLRTTIGRLNSQKSAKTKLPNHDWRNRKYRYIHASFTELPELEEWFKLHILKKFGTENKSHLDDEQLERAYTSLANKKRELMKKKM
ncbi:transcriptional regulator [Snodgrassella communis]|jgi:transcriptional regulator with XRE-family HTH domain|uniref:transcriptional regulator n=1 Tax=Snodgrassella communis TaxID=2946699 RepID=UPI0004612DC8|nr:transcriptional regulator [Snodgrassella communis]KDN12596.1 putative DNA-binding protein [Snodgrassella communis]PIT20361.1 hypothetical protein BGI35_08420 [Snodgrassella communis]